MQCGERHRTLNANGEGLCSVPMWCGGVPAGFCDRPAYGPQEENQERYGTWGHGWRGSRWYSAGVWNPGYCSGLACHAHGGPKSKPSPGISTAEGGG